MDMRQARRITYRHRRGCNLGLLVVS